MDGKSILSEILDYYKYKLDNNLCTMEEIEAASKVLMENMEVHGSISDFAKFYNTSENNVRAIISRKLIAKPKRILLYPFHKFMKVVPDKTREKSRGKNETGG